ncbi:MAG: DUF177 domain-containing protein [Oscillospiraceae bacterium]|nr:DUF177 domain-containing protein [Oscillospiraceae bacterium]
MPGTRVEFDYCPDLTELTYGSVAEIKPNARAAGDVRNVAGVLTLTADVDADMRCVCARCLKEFDKHLHLKTQAVITDEDDGAEDSDAYFLDGNYADVDEIIYTAVVLELGERMLCREDCKGLCDKCGADLNEGPCSCKAEIDPRLAVLKQLLEND